MDYSAKLLKFPSGSEGEVSFALQSFIMPVFCFDLKLGEAANQWHHCQLFPCTFFLSLYVNVTFSFHPFLIPLLFHFLFATTFPIIYFLVSCFSFFIFACFDPSLSSSSKKKGDSGSLMHQIYCKGFSLHLLQIESILFNRSINSWKHSVIFYCLITVE